MDWKSRIERGEYPIHDLSTEFPQIIMEYRSLNGYFLMEPNNMEDII